MYDELVKRVRQVAEEVCEDYDVDPYNAEQRFFVIAEADDAIEDLEFACNRYEKDYKDLCAHLPKWIPVTERLPEEWWPVLGLIQYHDEIGPPSQQVLWYLGNGHWRETWRADMIESDVTHWMPLPEPPKEE